MPSHLLRNVRTPHLEESWRLDVLTSAYPKEQSSLQFLIRDDHTSRGYQNIYSDKLATLRRPCDCLKIM